MGLRVGVIQSVYAPWRGYFDLMADVDVFVLYDDVQYSKNSWRNRNRLKTAEGLVWMTVPVKGSLSQTIDEVVVDGRAWVLQHRALIQRALGNAPYFADAVRLFEDATSGDLPVKLSDLNRRLIVLLCEYLGVKTPIESPRSYSPEGRSTERLVDLLSRMGATSYVSGPSGQDYIDPKLFADAGIQLEYKTYDYAPYSQLWGPFEGGVSVLDLIANEGPRAPGFLKSMTPNLRVV